MYLPKTSAEWVLITVDGPEGVGLTQYAVGRSP